MKIRPEIGLLFTAASVVVEKSSWSSMGRSQASMAADQARSNGTNATEACQHAVKTCPTSVNGLHLPEW